MTLYNVHYRLTSRVRLNLMQCLLKQYIFCMSSEACLYSYSALPTWIHVTFTLTFVAVISVMTPTLKALKPISSYCLHTPHVALKVTVFFFVVIQRKS